MAEPTVVRAAHLDEIPLAGDRAGTPPTGSPCAIGAPREEPYEVSAWERRHFPEDR